MDSLGDNLSTQQRYAKMKLFSVSKKPEDAEQSLVNVSLIHFFSKYC